MGAKHVHATSTKKLVNIQELKDGHFSEKQIQWNSFALKSNLKDYFVSIPFFNVKDSDYSTAGKAVDNFIHSTYNEEAIKKWEENDEPPMTLESDMLTHNSKLFTPYLNTLSKKLQNKYCKYFKLKTEIPEYPGVGVFLWSGHKTSGLFNVDRSLFYNIVILRGRPKDIEAFTRDFGV